MFKLLIEATMSDGTTRTIASTAAGELSSWKAGGSPTTFNNIYLGEKYDARLDANAKGWAGPAGVAFDSSTWCVKDGPPPPLGLFTPAGQSGEALAAGGRGGGGEERGSEGENERERGGSAGAVLLCTLACLCIRASC